MVTIRMAIADLLLGVFCMPFTLIGQLLRDFIFGSFMCKTIPYFQGERKPPHLKCEDSSLSAKSNSIPTPTHTTCCFNIFNLFTIF
uniref:G-protein coupled receptors family 1 profile domain-containing protein n=1 Tax=Daphnia galeata TaxID=27404 RepID=A0A8J2WP67_9CRUS|nr:unnamed protein product [Daphnia galeata]